MIICGGVVVGVVRAAGNLGINDGEIKIYLLDTHARDTPPPCQLLCKPDIFFLLLRLSIWLICEPLGETRPPKKNPPLGEPTGGPFM